MHRRFFGNIIATGALIAASSCTQFPRHSNTLVFGTNTSLGVTVGAGATTVPSISVGYHRQEAVVMPLVANTGDSDGLQKPCNLEEAGNEFCMLRGGLGGATDAYSVLASFGAKVDANASTNTNQAGAGARVGLAQYFATGIAAQVLALRGGASVISLSNSAAQSADANGAMTLKVLANTTPNVPSGEEYRKPALGARAAFATIIQADSRSSADIANAVSAAAKATSLTTSGCIDKDDCVEKMRDGTIFPGLVSPENVAKMQKEYVKNQIP